MTKGTGKDTIVILDMWTMTDVARYPSAVQAAEDLDVNINSIRASVRSRKPAYGCYWVYAKSLNPFTPATTCWRKVRGIRHSEKLDKLINKLFTVSRGA